MLKNRILKYTALLLGIFALFSFSACDKSGDILPVTYPVTVAFVDVGQGDGIVIECDGRVIAIDGGEESSTYKFNLYLRSRGIKAIDCYIATHPHADHIGAIPGIFSLYEVDTVFMPSFSEINAPATKTYENFLNAVDAEGCEVVSPAPGDVYSFGALKLTFLAPIEESENYNNMSLVLKAEYGSTSFLFAGDAEKYSERLILASGADIRADVLKVGHHGSGSASGAEFIEAVSPEIAVISCGAGNDYGHPHPETLAALENAGAEIYRTDISGTIILHSDGNKIITE